MQLDFSTARHHRPSRAPRYPVGKIYRPAWLPGCKGFRDFFCVEAVRVTNPVALVPGEGWFAEMSVKPDKPEEEGGFADFGSAEAILRRR